MGKKNKDGYVLKSEVTLVIQNYIRGIQMNDYGTDSGIPQLYAVMDKINELPTEDVVPVKRAKWIPYLDGEHLMPERYYKCSGCGARGFRKQYAACPSCTAIMEE